MDDLLEKARAAAEQAYAPYSNFHVGAALLFADGSVVTGANVENASYGLSLCAETVAVAKAMSEGRRGALKAVAVFTPHADTITPCGRCRQVLAELAGSDGSDPQVIGLADGESHSWTLSHLLPEAFRYD
ncbi:cytidine deaminase [Alteraurantiacibacter aquimixticola]|uniref:Cytidine deaminase n=1 Tax=Alteraurantiacibacter aquimixticola TaxID=2489173 RepID=A0A4T3F3K8_9SPHN|nr:cytidine deaminase [Alteraurantiacibacter aquimixticola]TIX51019.1 cytidine deaminase [Alteraurantiacibacter aquimixticola]